MRTRIKQKTLLMRAAATLLLVLLTSASAWAQENTTFPLTSGQTWTNTTTNTKYTVSGEAGNLTLTASVADPNVNDGTATIADNAFYYKDMSGVKTFAIGDGITSIGEGAFSIAENVGISAITIGKDVTSIGKNAFREFTSSHTITFAANSQLTTIGENAFYHSSGLTSINLGDCLLLESIAINAFSTCTGLTTLDLSTCTNLATIENFAFSSCTNLTITILYSLNYGQYTFNGVHQLNRVSPTIDGLTFNETDGCFDIGTLTEFQTFLTYANNVSGTSKCQGLTFRLTADIDMTGQTYMPVGNFSGTFDGNSHAITGLSDINGLFAIVGPGGSVTGLTLSGVNISGGSQVGAVAGACSGVIENCHVTGTVSGASVVGGIVGYELQPGLGYTNNPHVSGCTFSGTVTGTGNNVGGIVGRTIRQIQDCTVTGSTISGCANVGGIAGFIEDANEGTTNYDISGCTVAGVSVSVAAGNEDNRGKVCGLVDPKITTDPEEIATIVHDNNVYYSVTCGEGITATYVSGDKMNVGGTDYYKTGATFTIGHTDRPGYTFSGYEASAGTLSGTTLTMPDADVIIAALWEAPGIALTIGSSGWATWYDTKSYTLSSGATAYYVSSVADGTVNLTAIEGGVPAGVPVLINGSGTVTLTPGDVTLSGTPDTQFKGTATELTATDFTDFTDGRTYVLYGGKFMLVETNGGIGAHKCWLTLTAPTTARQLNISVEGATNLYPSIIATDESTQEGGWYDLQGRKLSDVPTKQGIYIFKGKKVKR